MYLVLTFIEKNTLVLTLTEWEAMKAFANVTITMLSQIEEKRRELQIEPRSRSSTLLVVPLANGENGGLIHVSPFEGSPLHQK